MKLPNGTKINRWRIVREKSKKDASLEYVYIKRWVRFPDGKKTHDSLPPKQYEHIKNSAEELASFVRRLNAEQFKDQNAIEIILDRTAFLSPQILEKYQRHLELNIPSPKKAKSQFAALKRHIIFVFSGQLNLKNPKDWYSEQDRWAEYLLGKTAPASAHSKKALVNIANRFIHWLHKQRPTEMPLFKFDPLSPKRLETVERDREIKGKTKQRRNIPDNDWKKIRLALPENIRPWILLCYHYGLRRSEALGLTFEGTDCVYQDGIELKRQLTSYNYETGERIYSKLKTPGRQAITGRKQEMRNIPHWLGVDTNETCDWIEQGMKTFMHPDTLTHRWKALMKKLEMDYDIHELRHTWISRARAEYPSRAVQLAAGHSSIETTERYSHDLREPSRERVRPKTAAAR